MDFRLPIPKNWQAFESICHRLWSEIWNDPSTQKNGRQGQSQKGVDIFGRPIYKSEFHGVQCKDKNCQLGSELTSDELETECKKAIDFLPKIESFTLATTASRDQKIQELSRNLTENKTYPFYISIWSWDDIESEIAYRPMIMKHYYPQFPLPDISTMNIKLNRYSTKDHLYAFFSRPQFEDKISSKFKSYIMPLIYELTDNAYKYGKATSYEIKINNNKIELIDNGIEFDLISQLDGTKVNPKGNVGSFVFQTFINKFKEELKVRYTRKEELNILEISGKNDIFLIDDDKHIEFDIDLRQAYGRENARKLASKIPLDKDEIYLNFGEVLNVSVAVEFVRETLDRMKDKQTLTISISKHEYLGEMENWFKDKRLIVKIR